MRGVAVVTGFVAKDLNGNLTTLGRNGSDLTASTLAEALGAKELQFWKPVAGILTADPALVPEREFHIALVAMDFPNQPFVHRRQAYGVEIDSQAREAAAQPGQVAVEQETAPPVHRGRLVDPIGKEKTAILH